MKRKGLYGIVLGAVAAAALFFARCDPEENLTEYGRMARAIRADVLETGSEGITFLEFPFPEIPLLNMIKYERKLNMNKRYAVGAHVPKPSTDVDVTAYIGENKLVVTDGDNKFFDDDSDGFADGYQLVGYIVTTQVGLGSMSNQRYSFQDLPITTEGQKDYQETLFRLFKQVKK